METSVPPGNSKIFIHLCPPGDPKQDLAYERQYEQQTYQVIPEVIKNFIQYFHKTVSDLIDQKVYELQASRVSSDVIDQKVYEIQDIYENRCVLLAEGTALRGTGLVRQLLGRGEAGCWSFFLGAQGSFDSLD